MKCLRCGVSTPRLTRDQTRCPQCQREVDQLIATDRERRSRFDRSKDLTGVR